ncbi:TonB-dependent receptor [Phocaeicola vulgatus]|uniref:TonB-dependent receptor n=1 Tax=Phocaeicola vulgatus TaxID=821 RepID=UPI00125CCB19|nr:TonB-dependent receptor [Phocaeicola vulgatus]MDU7568693.1 TonB-dependent receptor [Bacteroides sp.]KAB5457283.1 TonB-dependent receptor [Phocaeicola vulgatus]MCE9354593.1 TonB-dependent receptor [Phocaeicola vulgatus]MDB0798027.1 TonB-dependent receptor [Phocaeicola vulgatus]NMW79445.1 TonB-dependent receptor [Phocaeicola vulgatus]
MKITLTLVFVSIFSMFAGNIHSQNARITFTKNNATLESVLNEIENQTDYLFIINSNIDTHQKVSVRADDTPVSKVLDELFHDTEIHYTMEGSHIVLSNKPQPAILQQTRKITGRILDENGEPLIGVSVMLKGTSNGTITNIDGDYTLSGDITDKSVLEVTYIGMKKQEITVGNRTRINITMTSDNEMLDEVIVVGYGTQRKGNLTGSVSAIKSEKLTIAPIGNVTNALAGQLPGLIVKQTSGIPGSDGSTLRIRGFDAPLVIVDGIEGDFNNIDASQIESISILKDGAASIYGARAGNGVILVTTKRGIDSKPVISLNTSFTLQGQTNVIKPGSSGQRAEWLREEHINKGLPMEQVPYTEEQIQKYYNGTDPNYLNSDWYDAVIRDWAPQQNHNLSIRGGSNKIKYYGYIGYNDQETIVKTGGGSYKRYNVQSNIDAKITDRLSFTLDMLLTKENQFFPTVGSGFGHSNFWSIIYDSDPRYPIYLPDRSKLSYGGLSYGNALFASNTNLGGYSDTDKNRIRANGGLIYEFKYVKGLKAKMSISYDTYNQNYKYFNKQGKFYSYNIDSDTYTFERASQDPTGVTEVFGRGYSLTQQYSLQYERLFKEKHRVSALALFETIDYNDKNVETGRTGFMSTILDQLFAGNGTTSFNNGWESEMGRASWVGRINYSYMDKYLIETILRADASAKFPQNSRWGYFPSVSLGWVLSQESFMKSLKAIDNIKLRASYGESGNDNVGSFKYLAGYAFDGSYKIGDEIKSGLYAVGLANPILTWETMKIYNGGIDLSFFNRKLYGTVDAFYRVRDGIPGSRSVSLPSSFGAELPLENLNSIDTRGWELNLGTSGNFGNFMYDISGNLSWARSKWRKYDEPIYSDPDQERIYKREGRWTDVRYGYISDGLFTSQAEIEALDFTYKDLNGNSSLRPGDIKYVDLNGDKVLDWKDQKEIGKGTLPTWTYGFNMNFKYHGFDLSALFQGAFGYTTYIDLTKAASTLKYDNRWTEKENNPNSLVARPGGASTNKYYSDFNNHNTAYLRLKNLSIGYELPKGLVSKAGIQQLRIYIAGTNLFTLSSLHKYGVDPEVPEGSPAYYYPQQRTLSVGLNLSF